MSQASCVGPQDHYLWIASCTRDMNHSPWWRFPWCTRGSTRGSRRLETHTWTSRWRLRCDTLGRASWYSFRLPCCGVVPSYERLLTSYIYIYYLETLLSLAIHYGLLSYKHLFIVLILLVSRYMGTVGWIGLMYTSPRPSPMLINSMGERYTSREQLPDVRQAVWFMWW